MRETVMYAAGDVRIENVPDTRLIEPTDALVVVRRAAICGSGLWPYKTLERTETGRRMGHEAIGVVADVGARILTMKVGDVVIMPSLLTLSDVMGTGHHAAVAAEVGPGKAVAVVGDGAVGLCGVIGARRLGAGRIILLGRHPDRIALAREFGATDVVSERGGEAVERVRELTDGYGVHSVLECVGLEQSMETAIGIARAGGAVGRVGVPQGETMPASRPAFYKNLTVGGRPAPARAYIEELLPDVLEGRIDPGRVFDQVVRLDEVPDGYRAIDDREAIKVMVEV